MKLFERDYMRLTDAERTEWQSLREAEVVDKTGSIEVRVSKFHDYPKAARHFDSLFPNQYLDIVELADTDRLNTLLNDFQKLIDSPQANEREILNYISSTHSHFIIGAILKNNYSFGHHDAFLFREFPLGTSHKADYLLVGQSSDGWSFVFVELESPNENVTLKNGDLGASFRKGLNQISDWDAWIDGHFPSLTEVFSKCKHPDTALPDEFVKLDKSRIHYVVVAGRRTDFLDKTYRTRRTKLRDNAELILHYDNVVDAARGVIGGETY